MGNPMCRNLLKHRYSLRVYDVVPELARKVDEMFAKRGHDQSIQLFLAQEALARALAVLILDALGVPR